MRLLLIRHGQTDANVAKELDTAYPGTPLNEHGHDQARRLVGRLDGAPVDAVYASDLTRAQETAAPLAADRGLEVTVVPDLKEIQVGDWEMTTDWAPFLEVARHWSDGDLDARSPGGESGREFLERYSAAMTRVHDDGHANVAVVSHGAAMRVWVAASCPNVDHEFLSRARMGNTTVIEIDGTPTTGWRVLSWSGESLADAEGSAAPAQGF